MATDGRRQVAPGTGSAAGPSGPGTGSAHPPSLEHRRLLEHPPGFRPFLGTGLFERASGQPAIDRLVDLLYEGIGDDDQLRPLFPRDLAPGRSMSKLFFAAWLGGPPRYSEQAHAGLRHRHDGLPITPALAGRWLGHFRRALEATVAAAGDREAILAQVRPLALALVSGQAAPATPSGRGTRRGGKGVRALLDHGASANDRRAGDPEGATGVRALNATALHYAVRAGFLRTIEVLLDHGADPDARDSHGRTPLDWLDQAAPSVPRAAVRNLIAPGLG